MVLCFLKFIQIYWDFCVLRISNHVHNTICDNRNVICHANVRSDLVETQLLNENLCNRLLEKERLVNGPDGKLADADMMYLIVRL